MSGLPPDVLARSVRAAYRGEYFNPGLPLLSLPILAPAEPEPALQLSPFSVLGQALTSGPEQPIVGVLTLTPDTVYQELGGQSTALLLTARTPVRIEYVGVRHSPAAQGWRGLPPASNFVQVGPWPRQAVLVRRPTDEPMLLQLLLGWYERGVPVREICQGQRTFLLNPRMSYEEVQAFKKKYGVTLYD